MNNELQNAWDLFLEKVKSSSKAKKLLKAIEESKASYVDAQEYSSLLSNLLMQSVSQIYPTNSEDVLKALKDSTICKNYFSQIDNYTYSMQKTMNKANNIGLNAVKTSLKTQLVSDDVISTDNYKNDISRFTDLVELSGNKRVDTIQQANAKFQDKAGYSVTVSRKYDGRGLSDGRTCKWCLERAKNNIPYKQAVSMGMFQRHEGCHCMIEYNNNGAKTYQFFNGGRNSWGSKENPRNLEDGIIQKKNEIRPNIKNVTKSYIKDSSPGIGTIQAEEAYYEKNNHEEEIENSRWLLEKFGGVIRLVTEPEIRRIADYEWDGAYWELKSPKGSGKRTISNQFNNALQQIKLNPGGLILETKDLQLNLSNEKLIKECADEMIKKRFPGDVMIKRKNKLIAVLHNDHND